MALSLVVSSVGKRAYPLLPTYTNLSCPLAGEDLLTEEGALAAPLRQIPQSDSFSLDSISGTSLSMGHPKPSTAKHHPLLTLQLQNPFLSRAENDMLPAPILVV